MYNFVGRYNGLDRSSSKRIIKATLILGTLFFLMTVPLIVFRDSEFLSLFLTEDMDFYLFVIAALLISILLTYRIVTSKEDKILPELTILADGKFIYKSFKNSKENFSQIEFENENIKVIENGNKTLMITTDEGDQYILYKQYNSTNMTLKRLEREYPNNHYSAMMKWFELQYDRREKKLRLVLCYAADMNKVGIFDLNDCQIF